MSSTESSTDPPEDVYGFIGRVVGNIRIESLIAVGGMGIIYLGRKELTDREVAVKILRPERQQSDRDREYFVREAQALSEIRHPHLVELYSAGITEEGRNYMVLEYVPGRTLREIVEEEGVLSPLRAVRLFRQLLLALEATHAHDILHRDLKPDNLLIEPLDHGKERLRLADLGLVKFLRANLPALTEAGTTVGTPCYMSPEQIRGQDLDPRSDLYTTGVLLFEALTAFLPYPKAEDVDELLDHILDSPPAKLIQANADFERLSGLQRLLDAMLEKKPGNRPESADVVIEEMDRLLETELAADVEAALNERRQDIGEHPLLHSGDISAFSALLSLATAGEHIDDGMIIAFHTRSSGDQNDAAPPPELLRHLRTWLKDGGSICAAERQGPMATYGMEVSAQAERMLSGLPYLLQRAQEEFPTLSISAGVSLGTFETDSHGRPTTSDVVRRAQRFAQSADQGRVLICRQTSSRFDLKSHL